MQDFSILIKSDFPINDTDIEEIKLELSSFDGIEIYATDDNNRSGGFDPQILIALITTGNVAITTLIAGMFNFYSKKQEKKFKVVLEYGKDNSKIEIESSDIQIFNNLLKDSQDKISELKSIKIQKLNTKKTILFLASNPSDTGKLQLENEFAKISKSLQGGNIDFILLSEWAITANDLQDKLLEHKPNIVHFSGHGTNGINSGIILQDNNSHSQIASGEALADLFKILTQKFEIDVVVLNSCYSKEQAKSISKFVRFVVGMNNSINDNSAIEFSSGFYKGFASENDIEFAFSLAKNRIMLSGLPNKDAPDIFIGGELKQ